jgi:lysozyme family protein
VENFDAAVELVLVAEGVFSNTPSDPGGETWYGIARRYHPNIPWPPTREQAIEIYRQEYWLAHGCDRMPWPWALAVFDGVVNQDAEAVVLLLQKALGVVQDGKIGPKTLAAMSAPGWKARLADFLSWRAFRYAHSPVLEENGHGWFRRLFLMQQSALSVVSLVD